MTPTSARYIKPGSVCILMVFLVLGCESQETVPSRSPAEVVETVREALAARDMATLEQLVREDLIQHSSRAADGRQGLWEAAEAFAGSRLEVHRVLVDGDLVAFHQTYTAGDGRAYVAFEVFRVEQGRIAEHWDALQPLVDAAETASGRSMVDGPTSPRDLDQTDANRAVAVGFVDAVLTRGEFDRITDYISIEQYAQHNPLAADGLDGLQALVASLEENGLLLYYTSSPLVVAMGDFVLVGSEGVFGPAETEPYAVLYDLFRIEEGRIVEHWDVIPPEPAEVALPHDNGFF